MDIKIVKTNRSQELLILDGFEFHLYKTESETKVWKCAYNCKRGILGKYCEVKVKTNLTGDNVDEVLGEHYHDFPGYAKQKRFYNQALKEGGEQNLASSGHIIADALSQINPIVHGFLCSKTAAYAKIRRARQKAGHTVKIVYDEEDLPEKYRVTLGVKPVQFFWDRLDSSDGHGLLFTTEQNLESLAQSKVWYADGVFNVTEKTYLQMYTIMGSLLNDPEQKARPLVYFIMDRKDSAIYREIFLYLKEYFVYKKYKLRTKFIKIDYEMAVKRAIDEVFEGQISCSGCSFHLRQNLIKKAHKISYGVAGRKEEIVNRIYALAFVPIDRVPAIIKKLKREVKDCPESLKLLKWFYRTYVAEGSRFFGWWNQWPMVDRMYPTTNNYAESFFSSLRKLMGNSQSGLLTLIKTIQMVQASIEGVIYRIQAGTASSSMPYLDRAKKVKHLLENHKHNDVVLLDKLGPLVLVKVNCKDDIALTAELPSVVKVEDSSGSDSESSIDVDETLSECSIEASESDSSMEVDEGESSIDSDVHNEEQEPSRKRPLEGATLRRSKRLSRCSMTDQ